MQVLDAAKRKRIQATAARLFATRPFHKVRLEDVALKAGIGKGTLYCYFENKDQLYLSIVYEGFSGLVDRLDDALKGDARPPAESLKLIVHGLVRYVCAHPHLFEILRHAIKDARWKARRARFLGLIEHTLRRGIAAGLWHDDNPRWTAMFIAGSVRSVILFDGPPEKPQVLGQHVLQLVLHGLEKRKR